MAKSTTSAKKGGRKPFAPKPDQRARVRLWAAGGISEVHIAEMLKISRTTLRKRFPRELESGGALERAANLERLKDAAEKGNVAAMKFLDARYAAAQAAAAWKDEPADQEEKVDPVGKREAAQLAAEAAVKAPAGWGDDLMPDGVVKFPTAGRK